MKPVFLWKNQKKGDYLRIIVGFFITLRPKTKNVSQ
jgi:hypothetical protein